MMSLSLLTVRTVQNIKRRKLSRLKATPITAYREKERDVQSSFSGVVVVVGGGGGPTERFVQRFQPRVIVTF